MASLAFGVWDRLGRPLEPCTPIREFVTRMEAAFPKAASILSWYADDSHYEAETPQDHTPFSATGWPLPSPRWVVHATDIMHRPDLGMDCHKLFAYWLAEAKAGRMPWLKYMIWRGQRYDVRNGWRPVTASGHFDHIHLSTRTDHDDTHLGSWPVVPEEDDMNAAETLQFIKTQRIGWYSQGQRDRMVAAGLDPAGPTVQQALCYIYEFTYGMDPLVKSTAATVDEIRALLEQGGGDAGTAAIMAKLNDILAELAGKPGIDELRDAVADLGEGGAAQVRADAD